MSKSISENRPSRTGYQMLTVKWTTCVVLKIWVTICVTKNY